jgi:hypothetical protein
MVSPLLALVLAGVPSLTVFVGEANGTMAGEVVPSSAVAALAGQLRKQPGVKVRTAETDRFRRTAAPGDEPEVDWVVGVSLRALPKGVRISVDSYALPQATFRGHRELDVPPGATTAEELEPRFKDTASALLADVKRVLPPAEKLTPGQAAALVAALPLASTLPPVVAQAPYEGNVKTWLARATTEEGLQVWLGLDALQAPVLFSGKSGSLYQQPLQSLAWRAGLALTATWPESPLVAPTGQLSMNSTGVALTCSSATNLRMLGGSPAQSSLKTVAFQRTPLFATRDAAGNVFAVDFPAGQLNQDLRVWTGHGGVVRAADVWFSVMGEKDNTFFTALGALEVTQSVSHAARWVTPSGVLELRSLDRDEGLKAFHGTNGPYSGSLPATVCVQQLVVAP